MYNLNRVWLAISFLIASAGAATLPLLQTETFSRNQAGVWLLGCALAFLSCLALFCNMADRSLNNSLKKENFRTIKLYNEEREKNKNLIRVTANFLRRDAIKAGLSQDQPVVLNLSPITAYFSKDSEQMEAVIDELVTIFRETEQTNILQSTKYSDEGAVLLHLEYYTPTKPLERVVPNRRFSNEENNHD